ncbi:hypothetical protein BCR42DRAFT_426413 [Absidia repens]|uniref:C2H2-type domain-containing protein n=1 Tax=Absidia repens TaxID=90262 RepID=A0A1X2I172_9FUNG|nr:hypothetical protein BCR42DRAFT_426413 [Absidia repens]
MSNTISVGSWPRLSIVKAKEKIKTKKKNKKWGAPTIKSHHNAHCHTCTVQYKHRRHHHQHHHHHSWLHPWIGLYMLSVQCCYK